jgi:hypothetical protein
VAGNTRAPEEGEVTRFVDGIEDDAKRDDSRALIRLMGEVTGEEPVLWGSVIGFGCYHYRYASGREGDAPKVGFSTRKANLTVYLLSGLVGHEDLLSRLGKHSRGKSCLYIKRLDDLDTGILRNLIARSVAHIDQVEQDMGGLPRMSEMPRYHSD